MKNVVAMLVGAFMLFSTMAYAGVLIDQKFDSDGSDYIDDTFGTLRIIEENSNRYARYTLNWYNPSDHSQGEGFFSSLIMNSSTIQLDSTVEVVSFDYQYSFEAHPKNGYTLNDIIMGTGGGADYFRVAFIDPLWTFDHEIFKHSFRSLDFSDELSSTAGLDFTVSDSDIDGFTHIEIDVSSLTSGLLDGKTAQLYMEIANGNEYYNNTRSENLLTLGEFNSSVSLDNVYVGEKKSSDPVPEPTACALFIFGVLFLVKRVRTRR